MTLFVLQDAGYLFQVQSLDAVVGDPSLRSEAISEESNQ
jgi:hypothetical protein